jgi:hypothetical protein
MANAVVVLNRFEAEEFESASPWACISIANHENDFANIREENRRGLLQLAFADITEPARRFILFHDSHAHEILDFVTSHWDEIDTLVIHCDHGISRSSAVAAAIARLKYGSEGNFLDCPYDPNPVVYRILREVASGRADFHDDDPVDAEENEAATEFGVDVEEENWE